jgi:hypothetical protein
MLTVNLGQPERRKGIEEESVGELEDSEGRREYMAKSLPIVLQ